MMMQSSDDQIDMRAPRRSYHRDCGRLLIICAAAAFVSPAYAAGDTTGAVSQLQVYNDSHNTVLVNLSIAPAGTRPSCATSTIHAGALNLATAAGQAQYAMLLSAQSANINVRVLGANTSAKPIISR